jgi:hypothetical protein
VAAFLGQLQLDRRLVHQADPGFGILEFNQALHLRGLGMAGSLTVFFQQRIVLGEQARIGRVETIQHPETTLVVGRRGIGDAVFKIGEGDRPQRL